MSNMDPTKKPGVDSGAPEEQAVSASRRTPAMLPMSNPVRGRDNIKGTGPFSFGKRFFDGTYYGIQMSVRPS